MTATENTRGVNLDLLDAFKDMLDQRRWCGWYWHTPPGAKHSTKVPVVPGTQASASVASPSGVVWAKARDAATAEQQPTAGVGWKVVGDIGRVWIDIDKGRDPVTGDIAPWARMLLDWAETADAYREITPSGKGFRIMGRLRAPGGGQEPPVAVQASMMLAPLLRSLNADDLAAWGGNAACHPRAGIEVYHACARYVTVSGWDGTGGGDADLSDLVWWLIGLARERGGDGRVGGGGVREGARALGAPVAATLRGPIEDVTAALEVIPNEDLHWDAWVKIGLATVNATEGSDEGFEAFDLWSQRSELKYDAEATAEHWEHWKRSPADRLGIGWLMTLARDAVPGWKRPSRHAAAEFAPIAEDPLADVPGELSGEALAALTTPAGGERVSEAGIADAFEANYRGRLRYDHTRGLWFIWDGAHWRAEETRLAYDWASRMARRAAGQVDTRASVATQMGKASFARGVERLAEARRAFAVTHEVWDNDPWLLGTPGGTVDLRTGTLRPARPGEGVTRITAVEPAPDGGGGEDGCPLWFRFLREATGGDEALIGFLQRWFGYCLTGVTDEHALIFVYGDGGNGKGVLMNTIAGIMGRLATVASMDTFTASRNERHPADLAMLAGARLVVASEVDEGQVWAEARIKQITGGDPITARFMRMDFFTYTPRFKLTISGNHKPRLRNVDNAARRRFNIVPFIRRPVVPDARLGWKLRAEWPAILRWMIDGCVAWRRDGLERPAAVLDATKSYFETQDYFSRWLEERCVIDAGRREPAVALKLSFEGWCRENGETPGDVWRLRGLLERVEGVRYVTLQGKQFVRGIGLKDAFDKESGGFTPV
ncbi:MAG TPA: phage/plasmid primase, P4 family [Polyangia bacterium]|nr:phage/plasmid primase, P4 family [Polyangia bacterium]